MLYSALRQPRNARTSSAVRLRRRLLRRKMRERRQLLNTKLRTADKLLRLLGRGGLRDLLRRAGMRHGWYIRDARCKRVLKLMGRERCGVKRPGLHEVSRSIKHLVSHTRWRLVQLRGGW